MPRPNVNWHSAMISGLKIDLAKYADYLSYNPEFVLNTGPRRIDCLIEKKRGSPPIESPLAACFRQYNLIDYKSPYESMTVDNFYKVLSYAFSLPELLKGADILQHLSVTLVTHKYPRKLIKHIKEILCLSIDKIHSGIYLILNPYFPIQIIVLKELSQKEYLWLHCLTNQIGQNFPLSDLASSYSLHQEEKDYRNYMNQFIRANYGTIEGVKLMCEALYELFADELVRREQIGEARGEKLGEERGEKRGEKRGENRVVSLISKLISENRGSEIERVVSDAVYRKKLMAQYKL